MCKLGVSKVETRHVVFADKWGSLGVSANVNVSTSSLGQPSQLGPMLLAFTPAVLIARDSSIQDPIRRDNHQQSLTLEQVSLKAHSCAPTAYTTSQGVLSLGQSW
jgi:hypothetical protein